MATYSYLDRIPRDILCQVVSDTMTLSDYLKLRKVSQRTIQQVNGCLRHLVAEEDDEGYLFADLVRDMQVIETISANYPIYIQDVADLLYLAQHPTLHEATFDLSDLGDEIETFLTAITEFFGFYPGFGTTCQDCQGRYAFTFVRTWEPLSFIQVTEGSLTLRDIPYTSTIHHNGDIPYNQAKFLAQYDPFDPFFQEIGHLVPICEVVATLNENITGIKHLPCLTKLTLIIDLSYLNIYYPYKPNTVRSEFPFYDWFVDNIMSLNIKEYYISYPKTQPNGRDFGYFTRAIETTLSNNRIVYAQITNFFPIYLDRLPYIKKVLPNLTSIWLDSWGLQFTHSPQLTSQLGDYEEIVVVRTTTHTLSDEDFLKMFPLDIQDKVTFVDSDWLM